MDNKIEKFEKFSDERGDLVVFLKNINLKEKDKEFGQIYFVTFKEKDVVRGNHFHKEWREWFGVVSGKLKVILEDVETKKREELILDADDEKYIRLEIGPNVAHAFISLSPTASLLNYANGMWHPNDTFEFILEKE